MPYLVALQSCSSIKMKLEAEGVAQLAECWPTPKKEGLVLISAYSGSPALRRRRQEAGGSEHQSQNKQGNTILRVVSLLPPLCGPGDRARVIRLAQQASLPLSHLASAYKPSSGPARDTKDPDSKKAEKQLEHGGTYPQTLPSISCLGPL